MFFFHVYKHFMQIQALYVPVLYPTNPDLSRLTIQPLEAPSWFLWVVHLTSVPGWCPTEPPLSWTKKRVICRFQTYPPGKPTDHLFYSRNPFHTDVGISKDMFFFEVCWIFNWHVFLVEGLPPWKLAYPLKRYYFNRKLVSSNHQFQAVC